MSVIIELFLAWRLFEEVSASTPAFLSEAFVVGIVQSQLLKRTQTMHD